mgnify:FL=1
MRNPLRSLSARLRGRIRFRQLRATPVIVGGCERSGTSLLLSILSAHPSIHAIPRETQAFSYGEPGDAPGGTPIRIQRLYRLLGEGPLTPTAQRWAEKTPANVYYFRDILEHFDGDVRLIHIVRDGRDVVTSEHPSRPGEFWMKPRRWIDSVSAGLALEGDPRLLTIRYEDLVGDFEATAQAICDHLEEPFPDCMRNWWEHARVRRSRHVHSGKIAPIFDSSVRKFEQPDFPFRKRVDEFMAEAGARDIMERFGYI